MQLFMRTIKTSSGTDIALDGDQISEGAANLNANAHALTVLC